MGFITNSEHSENCTGGTNGWYARKGEVPTKDVAVYPFVNYVGSPTLRMTYPKIPAAT